MKQLLFNDDIYEDIGDGYWRNLRTNAVVKRSFFLGRKNLVTEVNGFSFFGGDAGNEQYK